MQLQKCRLHPLYGSHLPKSCDGSILVAFCDGMVSFRSWLGDYKNLIGKNWSWFLGAIRLHYMQCRCFEKEWSYKAILLKREQICHYDEDHIDKSLPF